MPVRQISPNLTLVHVIAILFTCIILVVSIMLGAQYIVRYRKYELTGSRGEPDSPAHTPRASITSLTIPSRAVSTSTLLSEVVSLVKLRPKTNHRMKHSRLRESVDGEALEMANDRKQCDRYVNLLNMSCLFNLNSTFNNCFLLLAKTESNEINWMRMM